MIWLGEDGDWLRCDLVWALQIHGACSEVHGFQVHWRRLRQDRCWWVACMSKQTPHLYLCISWWWWCVWILNFDSFLCDNRMWRRSLLCRPCRRLCCWKKGRKWKGWSGPRRMSWRRRFRNTGQFPMLKFLFLFWNKLWIMSPKALRSSPVFIPPELA